MMHSLDEIIQKLEFKSNIVVADIFGCTKANISKRRLDGSAITTEELYKLYDHVLKMGWYNKIGVLQPLVDDVFSRLRTQDKALAEFTLDPWQHLIVFLPALEDVKLVYELLSDDMRSTEKSRSIKIYVPESQKIVDEVIGLFTKGNRLRLRYELTVYSLDEFPSLSGLLVVNGKLLLQPSTKGFLPLGDIATERYKRKAALLMQTVKTPRYGPAFVQFAGAARERLPGAADGQSIVIHYTGQLGGEYRLTVTCDDLSDEKQQWRMRLSARGLESVEPRSIELFDQAGRTIIKTRTDNLPWQGFWSEQSNPLLVHIDELLITEYVSPN